MRMETVRSDITKFEHSAALSLNDILGTVQDLSDDIRRECGHAIEDCQPEDLSELTSKLIWLCNLSAKIADRHADALSGEGRWGRLQNKLSALQEQAGAYQQTETRLRQLQTQVDQLEQDASRQQEALHRIQRLTEQKEGLERRLRMASQTDPRQIQAEIERLSGQLNTRQAEITQLLGRQADLQRQTAAQQSQLTDLQQQIDSAEPRFDRWRIRFASRRNGWARWPRKKRNWSGVRRTWRAAGRNMTFCSGSWRTGRGSFRIYSRNRAPWSLDMRR